MKTIRDIAKQTVANALSGVIDQPSATDLLAALQEELSANEGNEATVSALANVIATALGARDRQSAKAILQTLGTMLDRTGKPQQRKPDPLADIDALYRRVEQAQRESRLGRLLVHPGVKDFPPADVGLDLQQESEQQPASARRLKVNSPIKRVLSKRCDRKALHAALGRIQESIGLSRSAMFKRLAAAEYNQVTLDAVAGALGIEVATLMMEIRQALVPEVREVAL
jgi:hypothetical protein